jgi:hypothetical protein
MNSTVTDVKPKTTEQVRADARRRIIANAKKPAKRASPKLSSPLPKAHPPKVPVFIPSPLVPVFTEQTQTKFSMAVKALKAQGRSLHQRLLICHHHLQSDSALSGIDPRELLKELNSENE